ncbi:hypothetical protein [Paractinoplanes toevensis]|uniref:hypothetical protein n=1 Tax=Paractinoplanes toevensis TaxID=571911 RepID=UPI001BB4376B|nr:hypothetical protein [Actinoplanes toevensis]
MGAERLMRVIPHQKHRERAMGGIAVALVEAADHDAAERFVRRTSRPGHVLGAFDVGLPVLGELAVALAGAGRGARAEEIVGTMTTSPHLGRVIVRLAVTFVEVGDFVRAERAARTIRDPDDQAYVWSRLAEGLARAGEHERAEQLALSVAKPAYQAQALFAVAEVLHEAGHPGRGRSLIATALCGTFLDDLPLDRLSGTAPEVLRSLFDAVLSRPASG